MKPECDWHAAQDAWLADFFEGKRSLPLPGKSGSTESKERASAWKAAIKAHGKARRMSLAIAGNADANAALNCEATGMSTLFSQRKRRVSVGSMSQNESTHSTLIRSSLSASQCARSARGAPARRRHTCIHIQGEL